MTGNDAPTSQVEMAQQVIRYLVAAGRWRGKQRVGWRNNELLHDELVDSLEELPEDLEESLQIPLRHQLLELHRVQEDSNWATGSPAATDALKNLLRAVVEVEFAVLLAEESALGDGDIVPHAGALEGMEVQLDEKFLVVHYGVKIPLEAPTRPVAEVADLPVAAVEVTVAPGVDDGVAQQPPPTMPDSPDCDTTVRLPVILEDAPVYTAPQWDRRRESGGEWEGGSVAGWSETSEALTVLHMITMWHVARPQIKNAACGQGRLQYDWEVACTHLSPSWMVHPVYRYMDTHQPVRVGGGYRPPQDRPPPVVCS
jgi:hypothetical protein